MMLYKVTPEANSYIVGICVYDFQSFGETQAEKYFSELEDCFQFLSENPLVYRERMNLTRLFVFTTMAVTLLFI
jgi:plasmid stabilization system protein ParE